MTTRMVAPFYLTDRELDSSSGWSIALPSHVMMITCFNIHTVDIHLKFTNQENDPAAAGDLTVSGAAPHNTETFTFSRPGQFRKLNIIAPTATAMDTAKMFIYVDKLD